jgi:chromosome segregation and condensation protein ScpB
MIADLGDKGPVPAVDGVLNIAQHVGEADLMLAPQFLLARIAIRNPDVRMMAIQHVLGNLARPASGNLVQNGLVREEGHCQWGRPWCA